MPSAPGFAASARSDMPVSLARRHGAETYYGMAVPDLRISS
jgi:hypothetical protein